MFKIPWLTFIMALWYSVAKSDKVDLSNFNSQYDVKLQDDNISSAEVELKEKPEYVAKSVSYENSPVGLNGKHHVLHYHSRHKHSDSVKKPIKTIPEDYFYPHESSVSKKPIKTIPEDYFYPHESSVSKEPIKTIPEDYFYPHESSVSKKPIKTIPEDYFYPHESSVSKEPIKTIPEDYFYPHESSVSKKRVKTRPQDRFNPEESSVINKKVKKRARKNYNGYLYENDNIHNVGEFELKTFLDRLRNFNNKHGSVKVTYKKRKRHHRHGGPKQVHRNKSDQDDLLFFKDGFEMKDRQRFHRNDPKYFQYLPNNNYGYMNVKKAIHTKETYVDPFTNDEKVSIETPEGNHPYEYEINPSGYNVQQAIRKLKPAVSDNEELARKPTVNEVGSVKNKVDPVRYDESQAEHNDDTLEYNSPSVKSRQEEYRTKPDELNFNVDKMNDELLTFHVGSNPEPALDSEPSDESFNYDLNAAVEPNIDVTQSAEFHLQPEVSNVASVEVGAKSAVPKDDPVNLYNNPTVFYVKPVVYNDDVKNNNKPVSVPKFHVRNYLKEGNVEDEYINTRKEVHPAGYSVETKTYNNKYGRPVTSYLKPIRGYNVPLEFNPSNEVKSPVVQVNPTYDLRPKTTWKYHIRPVIIKGNVPHVQNLDLVEDYLNKNDGKVLDKEWNEYAVKYDEQDKYNKQVLSNPHDYYNEQLPAEVSNSIRDNDIHLSWNLAKKIIPHLLHNSHILRGEFLTPNGIRKQKYTPSDTNNKYGKTGRKFIILPDNQSILNLPDSKLFKPEVYFDKALSLLAPSSDSGEEKKRDYVLNIFDILKSPDPDVNKLYDILVSMKNDVKLQPELLLAIVRAINMAMTRFNRQDVGELRKVLAVLQELKQNQLPNKPQSVITKTINITISTREEEKQLNYLLDVLNYLQSPMPDKQKIYKSLVALSNEPNLSPNILETLVDVIRERLANVKQDDGWEKILDTIAQLNQQHSPNENGDDVNRMIKHEAEKVSQFVFPSNILDGEKQRNYVLQLLDLLNSPNPDLERIYDILVLIKNDVQINPNLLMTLFKVFNMMLSRINPDDISSILRKILTILEQLQYANTTTIKPDDNNDGDINNEITKIININFLLPENKRQRDYIIEVMQQLQSLQPNKKRIYNILVLLMKEGNLNPDLLLPLVRVLKKKLEQVYLDAEWSDISAILDKLQTPDSSNVIANDVKEVIKREMDKVLYFFFPSPNPDNEKQRTYILQILELLNSPKPDLDRINYILTVLRNDVQLQPELLATIVDVVDKILSHLNKYEAIAWRKVLNILEQLKEDTFTTVKPNDDSTFIKREIDKVQSFEFPYPSADNEKQRKYVLQVLELLYSPKPDIDAIYAVLTRLENEVQIQPELLSTIVNVVSKILSRPNQHDIIKWSKVLNILEKLKDNYFTTAKPNDDTAFIKEEIDEVLNYEFPYPSADNEKQRSYVLQVLYLLNSPKPDINAIYDVLTRIQNEVELQPKLLAPIVNVVNQILSRLYDYEVVAWRNVLAILKTLQRNNTTTTKPDDNLDIENAINQILNIQFLTPEHLRQRDYILQILRQFQTPVPNKNGIYDILVLLKNESNLNPDLISILVRQLHKILWNVKLDTEWMSILAILKDLQQPTVAPDDFEIVIKVEIDKVLNFAFPSPSSNNEKQRDYVLQILKLLNSPKPDVDRIYDILVLIQNNVQLHPELLDIVVNLINKILTHRNQYEVVDWTKILTILEQLKNNNLTTVRPDDDAAFIKQEIDKILNFEFPSTISDNELQRAYVLQILGLLKSPKPDVDRIYDVLVQLQKLVQLNPEFLQTIVNVVNKILSHLNQYEVVAWTKILAILEELKRNGTTTEYPDNVNLDIENEINKILELKFLIPEQKRQRNYILQVLRHLQTGTPNKERILELLIFLRNESNLNADLVSILVRLLRRKLARVEMDSEWKNIATVLDELQDKFSPTEKPNSDTVDFDYEISKINNMIFTSLQDKRLRSYVLEILEYLKYNKPNSERIYKILVTLKSYKNLNPDLLSILSRVIRNRRFDQADQEWKNILRVLGDLERNNMSPVVQTGPPAGIDNWGIVYEVCKLLNMEHLRPDLEKQRNYVLKLLDLLRVDKPDKHRIYEILIQLKNEVNLNVDLLSSLVHALTKRLSEVSLYEKSEWENILSVFEELKQRYTPGTDAVDEWGIVIEINKLLQFEFPSHSPHNEEQRQIVLQVLRLLQSQELDKNEINKLLHKLNKIKLHSHVLIILIRAVYNRLLEIDLSVYADIPKILDSVDSIVRHSLPGYLEFIYKQFSPSFSLNQKRLLSYQALLDLKHLHNLVKARNPDQNLIANLLSKLKSTININFGLSDLTRLFDKVL